MAVTSWTCTVCGYVHKASTAPDTCPVCGAPVSAFESDSVTKDGGPARWVCTVCG